MLVPATIRAIGFRAAGIVAGSPAAALMSSVAVGNGGAVAAGTVVAGLQAIGGAGMSPFLTGIVGTCGAIVGAAVPAWLTFAYSLVP